MSDIFFRPSRALLVKDMLIAILQKYADDAAVSRPELYYKVYDSWLGDSMFAEYDRIVNVFIETIDANDASSFTFVNELLTISIVVAINASVDNQGHYYKSSQDALHQLAEQVRSVIWGNLDDYSLNNNANFIEQIITTNRFNFRQLLRGDWFERSEQQVFAQLEVTFNVSNIEHESGHLLGRGVSFKQIFDKKEE